jgi:hypothetical protein
VLVVASSHTVNTLVPLALVDVVMGVSRFTVVDDAFTDRCCLVSLGGMLGMNRGLSLLSGGLRRLLRGKPTSPQGRTLSLLHGSGLEESLDFITSPMGLGVRWLGHVTKEHGGCDNILASSPENRGLACLILSDVTIDIVSSLSSSSAMCACRAFMLEGLLK